MRLLDDAGKEIFLGSIHQLDRTPDAVTLTAYDRGVYLTENQLCGIFTGTGRDIAGKIAARLGIPLGPVEDDGLRRVLTAGAGQSAFAILKQAAGAGRYISIEDGALTVRRRDSIVYPLAAQDVLEVTSRASIVGTVNRAVVVGRKGNTLASAENSAERTAYGRFQRVLAKSGDPAAQAKAALKGRTLSARVKLWGNLAYRCGGTVTHQPPGLGPFRGLRRHRPRAPLGTGPVYHILELGGGHMNVYSELWALLNREGPTQPAGLFGTLTAISPVTITVGDTALTEGLFFPSGTRFDREDIGRTVALLICEEGFWFLGFAGGGT